MLTAMVGGGGGGGGGACIGNSFSKMNMVQPRLSQLANSNLNNLMNTRGRTITRKCWLHGILNVFKLYTFNSRLRECKF